MKALLAALLAFIPPSSSLLARTASRAQGSRGREITLSGTLAVEGQAPVDAKLLLRFPLQCRLERTDGVKVAVHGTPAQPAGSVEGNAGPALSLLQYACPLLAFRGLPAPAAAQMLQGFAQQHGADLSLQSSLGRLSDQVVYVLGAGPRDAARPQLWLYKDSAAPARLIAQGGADLRLLDYGSPAAAEWFPRVLELWEGGKRAARFEVLEAKGVRFSPTEDEEDNAAE